MNAGDWITLFAVVVALGIGASSLVQTRRLEWRRRREQLLNTIGAWARDILEGLWQRDNSDLQTNALRVIEAKYQNPSLDTEKMYKEISGIQNVVDIGLRSIHMNKCDLLADAMRSLAKDVGNNELAKAVDILCIHLAANMRLADKALGEGGRDTKYGNRVSKHTHYLDAYASTVVRLTHSAHMSGDKWYKIL